MNMRHTMIVLKKEVTDLLRDRKTWMTSVFLPLLLIPLLMMFIIFMQSSEAEKGRSDIPIVLQGGVPAVADVLASEKAIRIVEPADPEQALRDGEIRAIVKVAPNYERRISEKLTAEITIGYLPSNQKSSIAYEVIGGLLEGLNKSLMASRLAEVNVTLEQITPLAVAPVDLSTDSEKAGTILGFVVPMLLLMSCVTGALPAATDLMAGEKERGTLESLLTAPVHAMSVLTGKLITVSLMGFLSAISSVVSMLLAFSFLPQVVGAEAASKLDVNLSFLSAGNIVLILIVLFFVSIMFSSLMLGVSSLAKSFKEAQAYLTPFVFAALVPVYGTMMLSPNEIPTSYFFVPVMNAASMFKELLYGIVEPVHIAYVLGSSAVFVMIAVVVASRLFRRESLIVKG